MEHAAGRRCLDDLFRRKPEDKDHGDVGHEELEREHRAEITLWRAVGPHEPDERP
jgi:hypothetical protein